jgi:tetratricopeptide (TPR) repeat protein
MKFRTSIPAIVLVLGFVLSGYAQDRDDLKKARAALRKGEYESAARMFERLSGARPDSWDPRAGWVRALLEQGKRPEAAGVCDAFLKAAPDHPGALLALAQTALESGDPERALALAEKNLGSVRSRALAARALEELDRIAEAVRTSEPLVELYNKNRDEFMKDDLFATGQGLALYARYAGKHDLYKQVVQGLLPELLQSDPGDAWARSFLGRCFLEKYNRAAADEAFKEALQANPNLVSALLGLARLRLNEHQAPPALLLVGRALEINPSSEEAHAIKAEALFLKKDRDGALEAVGKGLASNPRSVRLHSLRGAIRNARGDAEADEDVRRALAIRAGSPLPYWEAARFLLLGGDRQFDEAQTFFRKAVGQNGAIPDLLIDYGMNSLRVGDEATAKKLLEEAYAKDPFNVRVTNSVNLLHDFEKDFVLIESPHFRVRLARSGRRWEEREVLGLLERAWSDMAKRYGFAPADAVVVEVFPRHSDFSVRTMGVPGLGALGACFGRVVTTLAPRSRVRDADLPPYRWGEVLWHEMAHVFSVQLSGYRVPSWFTEGLATYEEGLGFRRARRETDLEILLARHRGDLGGVRSLESEKPPANPILTVYLQGGQICRFIAEQRGFETIVKMLKAYADRKKSEEVFREILGQSYEEFDKEFFAWLDVRLARLKFRRPVREPTSTLLAAATGNPKDAIAAAKLAFALLESGDEAGAENFGKRAVDADPSNAAAQAAYGQALLKRRQPQEALPHLRKGTDDYQNWDALGRALGELDQWREAAEAFRKAADGFPVYLEDGTGGTVYHRLNSALLELKDYPGAMKALEEMVAADPLNFRDRLKLARLYEERGDREKLGILLDEAAALEPRDLALLDLQASLHRARKEYAKATERSLAAVALLEADGKDDDGAAKADRFCAIGEDWLAQGDKPKGLEYAQEALRLVSGLERARKLYEACRDK